MFVSAMVCCNLRVEGELSVSVEDQKLTTKSGPKEFEQFFGWKI
jgi:hypothetical protein